MFIEHIIENYLPSTGRWNSSGRILSGLLTALFALIISITRCEAQTYTVADIGYTPAFGTFSLNTGVTPPTYSTGGSGTGIPFDKLSFARTPVSGNTGDSRQDCQPE